MQTEKSLPQPNLVKEERNKHHYLSGESIIRVESGRTVRRFRSGIRMIATSGLGPLSGQARSIQKSVPR